MKKPFLFFILSFQLQIAICQTAYFQQQVNYKIDVTLNDVENTFDGFEIIEYTNNSPDTLRFIWFHLWPNAYKSDRTAFSEQLLQIGRTDFYFSNDDKRGYINRLDFKVNGVTSVLEDHPLYIDVAKLILPTPLAPH
ncbi:MAG: M1 family peptidase, partial [Bacteroidota bacterium]|nr:M1 family peptidase [Bacteroidota bacterium]